MPQPLFQEEDTLVGQRPRAPNQQAGSKGKTKIGGQSLEMHLLEEEKKGPKVCHPVRVILAKGVNRALLESPKQRKRDKPSMPIEQAGGE